MSDSFIPSDGPFLLWAAMLLVVAGGMLAERTALGRRVSGAIVVLFAATLLSNLRVLPMSAPAYDVVWSSGVPIAVALLLFRADLRRILSESGRVLLAFSIGAAGTIAGALLGFALLPLGEHGADLVGVFSATYIGGSMNFAAVAQATGFDQSALLSAAVAADNVAGTAFLMLIVLMPTIGFVGRYFTVASPEVLGANDEPPGPEEEAPSRMPLGTSIAAALALALTICAASRALAPLLGGAQFLILVVTVLTVAAATAAPRIVGRLRGAEEVGFLLMYLFFVVIGAQADILEMIEKGLVLFAFAGVIVLVHLVVLLAAGRIARLELSEMLVGSNACVLGPATAAAMAGALGWRGLVTPGILTGTLGYVIANFIGVFLAGVLR